MIPLRIWVALAGCYAGLAVLAGCCVTLWLALRRLTGRADRVVTLLGAEVDPEAAGDAGTDGSQYLP